MELLSIESEGVGRGMADRERVKIDIETMGKQILLTLFKKFIFIFLTLL